MKYVVERINQLFQIRQNSEQSEQLIHIDCFENLSIYYQIAKRLSETFKKYGLSYDIKLSKRKLEKLANKNNTSEVNSLISNDWVTTDESITYYRNLHNVNVRVLMGTEDDEDRDGLINCYGITPKTLQEDLKGKYSKVFLDAVNQFSSEDISCINHLYSSLFKIVPIDIIKFSDIADSIYKKFNNIDEFIELFFLNLPAWGLPVRIDDLPSVKSIIAGNDGIDEEYDFISRSAFKKLTKTSYQRLQDQFDKYKDKEDAKYSPQWPGWESQGIKDYDHYKEAVLSYARGERSSEIRKKLLYVDFSIFKDIRHEKVQKGPAPNKNKNIDVVGTPLVAFTKVFLYSLRNVTQIPDLNSTNKIIFKIVSSEIVCDTPSEDQDSKDLLLENWVKVCARANGAIEYINSYNWMALENPVDLELSPGDFFDRTCSAQQIENGLITVASSNKTNSRITFQAEFFRDEVNLSKKNQLPNFTWSFSDTTYWYNQFSDLLSLACRQAFIPLATTDDLHGLILAKSEDEFFDVLTNTKIDFSFDINKYIEDNLPINGNDSEKKTCTTILEDFNELGIRFEEFVKELENIGFYKSLLKYEDSSIIQLIKQYDATGNSLLNLIIPEEIAWVLDAYINAFNIEANADIVERDEDIDACIVPPWHPAALQKIAGQCVFFLDGCFQWWNNNCSNPHALTVKYIDHEIETLVELCEIPATLDLFPTKGSGYFGIRNSFGTYSLYSIDDIKADRRVKDYIQKDAIYDDDFDSKAVIKMNDNARMILDVLKDYSIAFPDTEANLNLVFVNPSDLQPIVAAIYQYEKGLINTHENVNINIQFLVKPDNSGGRNYLKFWMDEFFSGDENVNVKVYLNVWTSNNDLDRLLDDNNDIIYLLDFLRVNSLGFVSDNSVNVRKIHECNFPLVYKPSPISKTTQKRKIELTQSQFSSEFVHTQVVKYKNSHESLPTSKYFAEREISFDKNSKEQIELLHNKANWVACIDGGMDGALLKLDNEKEYPIIGFSTGKGLYGQYNLTITAKQSILDALEGRLSKRLKMLFKWDKEETDKAASFCIKEAGQLNGISLFSAINVKDHNINEFLAYVMTSIREKQNGTASPLKIILHLDSYKHWFEEKNSGIEDDLMPDFLILEVIDDDSKFLHLKATVTECKIATFNNSSEHKEKAIRQLNHGREVLEKIFDPNSTSVKSRYWYAQLYRALAFAQVTFSNIDGKFAEISQKLRKILTGDFTIDWNSQMLGYWFDLNSDREISTVYEGIRIFDIPQQSIQRLLLDMDSSSKVSFANIDPQLIDDESIPLWEDEENEEDHDDQEKGDTNSSESEDENGTLSDSSNVSTEEHDDSVTNETSASDGNTELVVNGNGINKLSDIRVKIGKDNYGTDVFWEFGNRQLANRHLLITGTSGQGKTYAIQTMLYELSKYGVPAVIFDYTEGFREDQLDPAFLKGVGNAFVERYIYGESVPINPFKRQEISLGTRKIPEKSSDIGTRIANIFMHVYKFKEQQFSAIYEAVKHGLDKYGDQMNFEYFRKELNIVKEDNPAAKTVFSKMLPFLDSVQFDASDDFSWGNLLYSNKPNIYVFQLTNFPREIQVVITELLLWDAWYYSKKYGNKDKPFVVVLDEAQNISHKENSPSKAILTEGRKFGWSAWYATQSLGVLDDDEVTRLSQAAFKLYFKPTEDEMTKISKLLDPTDQSKWISSLKALKKGQCIVAGDRLSQSGGLIHSHPIVTNVTSFKERN